MHPQQQQQQQNPNAPPGRFQHPAPGGAPNPARRSQYGHASVQVPVPRQPAASKGKRRIADKCIHPKIRELEPSIMNYQVLLATEEKLDVTLARKKIDMTEALKKSVKVKRRLRIYISHTWLNDKLPVQETDEPRIPMWELRVEGRLLDETPPAPGRPRKKFSSFFKSLVIELDRDLYGPDNHLVEWHRRPNTNETDGFQVKRMGDRPVTCRILLLLEHNPTKFKLHPRLAKVLGIAIETRPKIVEALWHYIRKNGLQDKHDHYQINMDHWLKQCFGVDNMKFNELPGRLQGLLQQIEPLVFHHVIRRTSETTVSTCYDIDVEVDDPVKQLQWNFLHNPQLVNDLQAYDNKIYELVDQINEVKIRRDFFTRFSLDPPGFIESLTKSQNRDLKLLNELVGDAETERHAEEYHGQDMEESVHRYMYGKVLGKKLELEQTLGVRHN